MQILRTSLALTSHFLGNARYFSPIFKPHAFFGPLVLIGKHAFLSELVSKKIYKADVVCKDIISDAQQNYCVFTRLKEIRQCLSEAMSELHATGKTSSDGEDIRTLFRTKISHYDKITEEAVKIISGNHLKKAKTNIHACKMEINKSINLFYDASEHPKYDVDFSELIKEYRKPKDLEDAKFLFELELNKCTYYHNFSQAFDAFKVLMIEYYRSDGGSKKRYKEEINGYHDRFMRVVESAVENTFLYEIQRLKGDYFDHTLRINKLWREIQIHTKDEVKDLDSAELIKEGVVPAFLIHEKKVPLLGDGSF